MRLLAMILLGCAGQSTLGYAADDDQSGDDLPGNNSATVETTSKPAPVGEKPVENEARSGNYLEIGWVIGDSRNARRRDDSKNQFQSPYLQYALYWRALFAEAKLAEGENYGATLWQDEHWALDLLALSVVTVSVDEEDAPATTDAERTERVYEREAVLLGSGFRLSRYSGSTLLRFQLLGDIYESHGFGARVHVGRRWQLGNWDTRARVGVSWMSDRTADYLFGIDADEATSTLSAVEIGDTALLEFNLSASYPLSRHWVVHADAAFNRYDGSIGRSALVDRPYDLGILASIGYVF